MHIPLQECYRGQLNMSVDNRQESIEYFLLCKPPISSCHRGIIRNRAVVDPLSHRSRRGRITLHMSVAITQLKRKLRYSYIHHPQKSGVTPSSLSPTA